MEWNGKEKSGGRNMIISGTFTVVVIFVIVICWVFYHTQQLNRVHKPNPNIAAAEKYALFFFCNFFFFNTFIHTYIYPYRRIHSGVSNAYRFEILFLFACICDVEKTKPVPPAATSCLLSF